VAPLTSVRSEGSRSRYSAAGALACEALNGALLSWLPISRADCSARLRPRACPPERPMDAM